MKKCKWAGDPNDEYCESCNGITMEVDGNSISCIECAGYEAGEDEVECADDVQTNNDTVERTETPQNNTKTKKVVNTTPKKEKHENEASMQFETHSNKNEAKNKETTNKKENKAVKVKEEKKAVETTNDIKVVSMRYTSGATVKKGDNYFKFIAEEEWDVSQVTELDMENVREQLWAKVNGEVDIQIEELNNMN